LFQFTLLFKVFKFTSNQIDTESFKILSRTVFFMNAPPPKAITHLLFFSDSNTSLSSRILKNFSPYFLKISEIFIAHFFSIFRSVSINIKSCFFATILPKVDLPTAIIPNKTRFFFTVTRNFKFDFSQLCLNFRV